MRLLSEGPLVETPAGTPRIESVAIDGVSTSIKARTFASGSSAGLAAGLNDHAARLDVTAAALNGVYAIINGLELSSGTGLSVNVSAGQALVRGLVEVSASTVSLSASTTNRLWLTGGGAVVSGGSSFVPSPAGLFLGTVITNGSGVTTIDTSSVFYMNGGLPIRFSGDTFKPTDSPTAKCVHLVRTNSATWLWDGERYNLLIDQSKITTLSNSATLSDVIARLKTLGLAL